MDWDTSRRNSANPENELYDFHVIRDDNGYSICYSMHSDGGKFTSCVSLKITSMHIVKLVH